jgi:tripartite-type tricarboxylate transporter receptor subunit TctC
LGIVAERRCAAGAGGKLMVFKSKWRVPVGIVCAIATMGITAVAAHAQQAFPSRFIRIVSPFAAASVSDLTLRMLAERAGARLKTQVVVDNMPTGGGILAARTVKSSPADGHTLALLSNATAVTVAMFKNPGFDPLVDFKPISGMSDFAYLILAKQSGFGSMNEFIAAARSRPGALNVGTSAPGTTPYLTALLLKKAAGIEFTIVPFRGAADLSIALLRNDIDIMINAYGAVRQNLVDKQFRALAATTMNRSTFLPDVPTVHESGIPNFEVSSWNGIFAPAHTPADVVERLTQEFQASLKEPELGKQFKERGVEIWPADTGAVTSRMTSEITRWNRVIDEVGIERE